jgi:hypothetical protein
MVDRCYCTVDEIKADLHPIASEAAASSFDKDRMFGYIRSASSYIDRRIGVFIPTTGTRIYNGNGRRLLFTDFFTEITSLTNDGTAITSTQYNKYPLNGYWEYGPYNGVEVDPDATELGSWLNKRGAVAITGRWGKYEQTLPTGLTVQNATSISDTGTSLLVENETAISAGHVLLIGSEQVLVTALSGTTNTYTVQRGCNGTTAAIHLHDVAISKYVVPHDVNMLCRELAALAAQKAATQWAGRSGSPETGETFYIQEYPQSVIEQIILNYWIATL